MPEYTEIKLMWKYENHRNNPLWGDGVEEWVLFADDNDIAKFYKPDDAFMEKHKITGPLFVVRNGCQDLLPWSKLEREFDRDMLFELSDRGITSVNMEDIYTPLDAVMLTRNADGSIERASDWID